MSEKDWIEEAVKEFHKGCKELQDELSKAAHGTLLDVSDEQIIKNLEPLLKDVQQKAIQKALKKPRSILTVVGAISVKKMRHKGVKPTIGAAKADEIVFLMDSARGFRNHMLERVMREIRRRTIVVGCFPDGNSALMLSAARLRHIAGTKWGTYRYLNIKRLKDHQTEKELALAGVTG